MGEGKSIEDILVEDEALLDGHFKLRSGLHSSQYLQCALVFQHPAHAETIARRQREKLSGERGEKIDAVIGPATGGIIAAFELARALGCRALFAERVDDAFKLRRGFSIRRGERLVVAEDVITTGGAVKEVIDLVRSLGGEVVAVAAVVNRSGTNPFDVPFHYLGELDMPAWEPAECPLCRRGQPVDKPGSRREV